MPDFRLVPTAALAAACLSAFAAAAADSETDDRVQALDGVVVTATRKEARELEVAASVTTQDMRELESKGFYAGGDEFRGIPGVFFRRGQGDNEDILSINFRGFIGNHGNDTFLGLLDGLPFLSPDDELLLQEIPYAAVDRIELVRGPVSALYGRGGIAGAVNYITRTPEEDGAEFSLRVGSSDYRRLQATLARAGHPDGLDVLAVATHETAEGWRRNNQRETSNLFVKGLRRFGEAVELSLYADYMDKQYKTGGAIPTFADGTLYPLAGGREAYFGLPGSGQDLQAWFAAARVSWDVGPDLNWTNTVLVRERKVATDQSFYDSWLFDPDAHQLGVNGFLSDADVPTRFAESVLTWRNDRHALTLGANIEHATPTTLTAWSGQNGFTFECGFAWYANLFDTRTGEWINRDHPCQARDVTGDSRAAIDFHAFFVQDEIRLGERWLLTLGARYDAFRRRVDWLPIGQGDASRQSASDSHVSPKAALSYRIPGGQVYVTYGQGYSSSFGPIWQWDPAGYLHDTHPSTLDSVELGYKGELLDGRLQLSAAVFDMKQKNRIFEVENPLSWEDPSIPGSLIVSGPPLASRGGEVALTWRLGAASRVRASASRVDAEWKASDFYQRYPSLTDLTGRVPVGVPGTTGSLDLEHRFSAWLSGRLGYEWYDDYFITLDNGHKGGGYGLGNLSFTLTPPSLPSFTAELAVSNLFDREYYYFYGGANVVNFAVPGVPRQVYLDLRYRF